MREHLNISGYCEGELHSNCNVKWCDCECHNKNGG